ncbi:MAG TPA: hypothetical protein VMS31_07630 [Pyrinomonadaceae bacterium]|nr:hypothetical protein [Pyrinomonadaceae bacterium]
MADIKVDDLVRSIREQARESAAQQADSSVSAAGTSAKPLARLETSLTITGRSHDQLPPVTTYRTGLPARLELWIKRQLKRVTHWYTWEQVNFNSAADRALNNTLAVLQANEQRLAFLQNELDASLISQASLESRLAELESRLSLAENRFDAQLSEKLQAMGREHQQTIELLLEEQRVCFKQLALEISEAGVIADRTKRSIQLRVDKLAARLDGMSVEPGEVQSDPRINPNLHALTQND